MINQTLLPSTPPLKIFTEESKPTPSLYPLLVALSTDSSQHITHNLSNQRGKVEVGIKPHIPIPPDISITFQFPTSAST